MVNKYNDYFLSREVDFEKYVIGVPNWLNGVLESLCSDARILDIGCGPCTLLLGLRDRGFSNLYGIDLDDAAVQWGNSKGLNIEKIDLTEYYPTEKFDFISMNHVLEHIEKDKVIQTIKHIATNLLKPEGYLYISVPNGQSSIGCYWAYEDFTHYTLYTTGSLKYVLSQAGLRHVNFVDINSYGAENWWVAKSVRILIKTVFLAIYKVRVKFWNWVTGSAYHASSPIAYGWEIKALVKNEMKD